MLKCVSCYSRQVTRLLKLRHKKGSNKYCIAKGGYVTEQNKVIANYAISYFRFLNEQGACEQTLPADINKTDLISKLYQMMVKTRIFDKKAIALQRTGKLGTYPSTLGQEAICVGIGAAMQPDDVLCPYYREYGAQLWRGVKMHEILLYWGGNEIGSAFENNPHDFPICIPIASQTLHAVGAAFALQYKQEPRAVVATIGDGGTSRGDFYEAMVAAGVWQLPVVFVINNNQWAISVPRDKQCAAQTLAQKGLAAGIEGIQIDGNDIFAVTHYVKQALTKARKGGGPTVIEAMTYRMCDHTTADDASRYRSDKELKSYEKSDPIARLKDYMQAHALWDNKKEEALMVSIHNEVNQAVDQYLSTPKPSAESMFDYLYETLPQAYEAQYQALKRGDK